MRRSSASIHPELLVVEQPSRRLSRHERFLLCKLIDAAAGRSERALSAAELAELIDIRLKLSIIKAK